MGFKGFVKKKYGEVKSGIRKDMAERKEISTAAREAAAVERKKQAISTAVFREKQRGKSARSIKNGGGLNFSGGIDNLIGKPSKKKPPMLRF